MVAALKVPREDYEEITRLFEEEHVPQPEIAAKYGCCPSRISQVIAIFKSDPESPDFPHGKYTGYQYGCKCKPCRLAGRKSRRESNRKHGLFQHRRQWLADD